MLLSLLIFRTYAQVNPKNSQRNIEKIDEGLRGRVEHTFSEKQIHEIEGKAEKHEYQAEISKLMSILVDNLYENKDIFMRELISNANDALDKIRFQSLRDPKVLDQGPRELQIFIDVNEEQRTITITDTGIGMTKRDLVENLGKIAKSGTNEFRQLINSGDSSMIGQFGVGFYSSFLVADKVTVISKHNSDQKQWIWISDSSSHYTIVEDPRGVTLGRGTQIILHLKEKGYQYLDRDRLIAIIRHYSMFVDFPVKIWHHHEVTTEETEVDETTAAEISEGDVFDGGDVVNEGESESTDYVTFQDGQKEKKGVKKVVWQWEQVNNRQPLWMRDPTNIPDGDYIDFYKGAFKESNNPLYHIHFKAEGRITFNSLLFIPSKAPPADKIMEHVTRNVKLYVKRVLVADEWEEEILPDYLHFVKGVVDSADLPLNVDRDHLAKENTLKLIKRRVTSKLLSVFRHLFQFEPGVFYQFYKNFAGNLKYGVIQDSTNKRALSKLLLFYTSYSPNSLVTLDDYVSRMKKGQEKIYFIGSSNRESAAVSPYLEELYSRGIEVVFAIEPIDLYCLERMEDFDGIPLENPEQLKDKGKNARVDLSQFNMNQKDFNLISRWFKKLIGDKLEKISLSTRLKSTPAICTATNWGYTASHERLIRAQTVHDQRLTDNLLMNRKILELNPEHPTIMEMFERILKDQNDEYVKQDALLLYDTALLAGGFQIDGVLNFTKKVFKTLGVSHGLEEQINEFEAENSIFYTTIDDEFKAGKEIPKHQTRRVNIPKPVDSDDDDDLTASSKNKNDEEL